jgi:conjugal transfer pilus assembly protein TraV
MRLVPNAIAAAAPLRRTFALGAALVIAGCASIAGVGGTAEFGCKAPVGVKCDSVSGNYYNAVQQNLPSQQKSGGSASESNVAPSLVDQIVGKPGRPVSSHNDGPPSRATMTRVATTPEANAPLRSPPRVLRLWIKPWEDSDGDLHTQSYVYVPIDSGRWLIDHRVLPTRDVYTPTKALRGSKSTTSAAEAPAAATALRATASTPVVSGSPAAAVIPQDSSRRGDTDGR